VIEAKKDFLNNIAMYIDDILAAITTRINFPSYQQFGSIDETKDNIQSMNTEYVDMYMRILSGLMNDFPHEKVLKACESAHKKSLASLLELQQSIKLLKPDCKIFHDDLLLALKVLVLYFNIFTRNALQILNSISKMVLHNTLKLSNSQLEEILLVVSETKLPRSQEGEIALKVSTSLTT
jgi:hypothetical protein